ncbi:MAG TPA: hypothetical protein PKE21_05080 [Flavobacteriales bacterium]|nr:hypothetical protein [Flavobacteriales bacterium]HMR26832.1 hypothetical protein [Flavobacteriales bacterium]
MNTTALRDRLHALVDSIQSEALLARVHELLISAAADNGVWNTLTVEQQERVLRAHEASKDPANLRSAEEVFKRHRP